MAIARGIGRVRRALVPALTVVVGAAVCAAPGSGAWTPLASGSGAGKAKRIGLASAPSVGAVRQRVTVTWPATGFLEGGNVPGYVVRRYNAVTGVGTQALNACSGIVAALTCSENSVPAGTWQYTVTPAAGNWRGAESATSAVVATS